MSLLPIAISMRKLGENVFAVGAGIAIGLLAGFLTIMRILSEDGGADVALAAFTIGPAVMAEVTVGAITTLVLLANGRRLGAVLAGAAFAVVLLAELVWLSA
jgi:hypothetical protein